MGVIENSLLEYSESDTETWRMLVIIFMGVIFAWLIITFTTSGPEVLYHQGKGHVAGCIHVSVPNEETGMIEKKPCSNFTNEELNRMAGVAEYELRSNKKHQ